MILNNPQKPISQKELLTNQQKFERIMGITFDDDFYNSRKRATVDQKRIITLLLYQKWDYESIGKLLGRGRCVIYHYVDTGRMLLMWDHIFNRKFKDIEIQFTQQLNLFDHEN